MNPGYAIPSISATTCKHRGESVGSGWAHLQFPKCANDTLFPNSGSILRGIAFQSKADQAASTHSNWFEQGDHSVSAQVIQWRVDVSGVYEEMLDDSKQWEHNVRWRQNKYACMHCPCYARHGENMQEKIETAHLDSRTVRGSTRARISLGLGSCGVSGIIMDDLEIISRS